ncbi:MAG: hypothetical protein HYY15_04310 [Candidatus Omnitrophica bacterium]|nr:hypothetical protein [Candidatus Omnitrophota bacterium]
MRRALHALVSTFFVVLVCAQPAWAGAWTVPHNHWYVEYFYRVYQAKKDFNHKGNSGRKPTTASFRDIRNELKLEYGITDWWNLLLSAPYQSAHYRDDNTDLLNSGVGDIYVRTKLRFLNLQKDERSLASAAQFSWKIPSAYDPHVSPGLGDGQVDFESRLMLSASQVFEPYEVRVPVKAAGDTPARVEAQTRYSKVAFVNVEGGFTARNEDPANEFPMVFEAGFTPIKRMMLVSSVESTVSVNSTNEDIENFAKWGLRAIVNLWGDGFATIFRTGEPTVNMELGYSDVFAGRNTGDAFEVFGKLSVSF